MIPINDCKDRFLYRLRSRNLAFGVYCKSAQGFIGIREKFGSKYLFTEYHWDTGAPFGTAKAIEELEKLPDDIICAEELGAIDKQSKRAVSWNSEALYFTDVEPWEKANIKWPDVVILNNDALFNWLMKKEKDNASE